MQNSIVKRKLAAGEPVFMLKLLYQDPALFEMVGRMGFDCVWICNEHVGIDPSKLDSLIRACRASGFDAVIRTKPGDYRDILHPLEMGAKGLMIPRLKDAAEAREIVRNMKFYPDGRRGADGVNAEADFGLVPLPEYLKKANEENFLVVQVEDPETVEHIDEIAEVEGVDVIFIGPGDLSINLGVPGQVDHPEVMKVCERVVEACERNGKAAGIPGGGYGPAGEERTRRMLDMGFRFLAGASDYTLLKMAYSEFRDTLTELGFSVRDIQYS